MIAYVLIKPRKFVSLGVVLADKKEDRPEASTVLVMQLEGRMNWTLDIRDVADPLIESVFGNSRHDISKRSVTVAEMPGMEYIVEGFPKESKVKKRAVVTVLRGDKNAYIFLGLMPSEHYDERLPDYYKVVKAFRVK